MDSRDQFHGGTHYRVVGPNGPVEPKGTIVFIHGVGMTFEFWKPQIAEFSENYRCIAYDMLGHGKSILPNIEPKLEDYVSQLDCLTTWLATGPFVLVGHSMGALIAIEAALKMPERVEKLVAMNAVYERTPVQAAAIAGRVASLEEAPLDWTPTLARWLGDTKGEYVDGLRNDLEQLLGQVNREGYARTYRLFACSDRAHSGKLGDLAMPALFLTGEDDPNSTPVMSSTMAHAAPFGVDVVLSKQRHMMSFVNPVETNIVLKRFIEA